MDFVVDNAVALAAIILGVLILVGLVALAVTGLRLWRSVRVAQRQAAWAGAALAAEADRLSAALAAMPERQAELEGAVVSLQRRVAALTVLALHASEAAQVLRSPLRYVGR